MVQTKLIKLPIIKYFVHIDAEKNSEPFEMRTQAPLYVPLKTNIYQYIYVISHRAFKIYKLTYFKKVSHRR